MEVYKIKISNKGRVIVLIVLILFMTIFVTSFFKQRETILDEVKLKEIKNISSNSFALMLEKSDGSGYELSENSVWPTDMDFNDELSGCIDANGNKIDDSLTYIASNNSVRLKAKESTYCYIYFDNVKPSVTLTVSTDGTDNILPSTNKYKATLTCGEGTTGTFNTKYQRLEISQVSKKNTVCNLNYTSDTGGYTVLKSKVQSVGTKIESTNNAGGTDISYRYTGKTPSNYVWFNNELWRIIGVVPVCMTSGCGTPTTSLVKIIRNQSIGGLAYDAIADSYTGEWGSNTLYSLLNEYYIESKILDYGNFKNQGCAGNTTSTYNPTASCDYDVTGISDYYTRMIENVYWNTGATNYNLSTNSIYTSESSKQTVSGKIGIMTLSDFGYAGTDYTNTMYGATFANNSNTNWLFSQGYEWTSIQNSSNVKQSLYINGYARVNYANANIAYVIRPVVYLESSVYIISGTGTESDPYILGM